MSTRRNKRSNITIFVSFFAIISILVSSITIVFPDNAQAAPSSTKATCEAAGGEWKNLAPTGGVPAMGCSGASVASQQSLDWQVKSLLYYRALGKCFQQASRSSISYENMQSGEWFKDGLVAIGPYVRDIHNDVGDDQVMSCAGDSGKKLVKDALSLWGLSARDVLCGAGYTWNEFPNNSARCKDSTIGDGNFLANKFWGNSGPNPGTDGYISGRTANVLTFIKDRMYSGATPDLTGPGWYAFYRKVFFQQCDTTQKMSDGASTKPSGTDARDVMLKIVSDDGTIQEKWYRVDSSMGTNSFKTRIGGYPEFSDVNRTCQQVANHVNEYANVYAVTIKQNPAAVTEEAQSSDPTAGGAATEQKSSCVIEGVGWIICPIVSFLADIADNAFTFLSDNFLRVDTETVSTTSATYTAWASMRTIANVAFVIAFLFIIFSQLTGQGVANYGIKKMLPRLIIAALLVNVSFFICQIAIDLSNILGVSLKGLFDSAGKGLELPTSIGDESGNWLGIATAVLAGAGIAWALGLSVLLPFLLAAVIAFIMVFLILVVRQVLIILLVVVAPLAFVAFLLPNTEQWFTKWRKMFVSLLLVFPLLGLLFGAAGLASTVINTAALSASGDSEGWIMKIVAAGVIALPLFLLPSLLKASLNAVPAVGNRLNKIGDSLGKNARNKASNSGVMRSLANRKARTRASIGAGIYSGNNPLSKVRSGINSRLNQSRAFNAATGDYGTIRGAAIEKLESEETKLAESAINLKARGESGTPVDKQFADAIKRGDELSALAAQNILMRMGGRGVNQVRQVISDNHNGMKSDFRTSLANNIAQNHAQAAKAKSSDLLAWAGSGGSGTIESFASQGGTWGGLTARELADQTDVAFTAALSSGGVSAETIAALSSERMSENLSQAKRAALNAYGGRQATQAPATESSQTTATGTTQVPPQGATQGAPTAAQRAQQTAQTAAQGSAGSSPFVTDTQGTTTPPPAADGSITIPHNNNPTPPAGS